MASDIQLLIGKSGNKDILIDAQELVTGRTCVIGQSGSGKSYTIAVLCEKLLQNNIAFCIVDTEGEYFSLKQKFQVLWAGGSQADVNIEQVDFQDLIEKSIKNNAPLILDVSESLEQRKVVSEFSSKLYEIGSSLRQPYLLIVEEADKFVGQNKDSLKEIEEISKRGRKRGLGLLVATQRPSLVNKNVLSQCGNQLIGKLTTENDLKAVDLFFADRKELELLPKLSVGEFFVMGNLAAQKVKMKCVERLTQHKGLTPKLIPKATGKISELKTSLGISEKVEEKESIEKLEFGKGRLLGIKFQITKEQIEKIVDEKRKKKHGLFGEKEHVKSLEQSYTPLIYLETASRDGLIKKSIKTFSLIVDGRTGEFADVRKGLVYSGQGFSKLLGLDENSTNVLLEIKKNKRLTSSDLQLKAKLSESTVRKVLATLQDKKLATFSTEGKTKLYSLLVDLGKPDLRGDAKKPELQAIDGKAEKPQLAEDQLRKIVKGIDESADITKFEIFYYPIWQANLESRRLKIDGISGKEIEL